MDYLNQVDLLLRVIILTNGLKGKKILLHLGNLINYHRIDTGICRLGSIAAAIIYPYLYTTSNNDLS